MRILVTNDDGIDAPSIIPLAQAARLAGHDVVLAAPLDDRSGAGSAIGVIRIDQPLRVEPRALPGLEDVPAHGIDGFPALAVLAARLGAFGEPPDLVLSGINPGANTGRAVMHSGTVGAALTAANFGVSGLAVSLNGITHWETAAHVATEALAWLVEAPVPTVLNLNVPDLPIDRLRGVRWATLAPFGTVRTTVVHSAANEVRLELQPPDPEVAAADPLPEGSDTALVNAGYAAVSLLLGPTVAPEVPVADHLEARLQAGGWQAFAGSGPP